MVVQQLLQWLDGHFIDIMVAGRWAGERSCKLYIQKGEIAIIRMRSQLSQEQWIFVERLAPMAEFILVFLH